MTDLTQRITDLLATDDGGGRCRPLLAECVSRITELEAVRRFDRDSQEFAQQTAIMDALPHAIHPMHGDWRTKADALIDGLRARGWDVTPVDEGTP